MNESLNSAWQCFEKTGRIDAYLAFKKQTTNQFSLEAGEDFGFDKNIGDCDKRDEIRRQR